MAAADGAVRSSGRKLDGRPNRHTLPHGVRAMQCEQGHWHLVGVEQVERVEGTQCWQCRGHSIIRLVPSREAIK